MNLDRQQVPGLMKWLILINVSLSVFMATLDSSIVNIALPTISNELSVSISQIQWVVTAYLLMISLLLLVWGNIADIYGKKKIFAAGFIIFIVGSALCGFARNLELLVAARIVQAMGASAMMALSQGIITAIFPPSERGKALGITGTTVALGSLTGPGLGGILVDAFGWPSIFLINVPIGIIGFFFTIFVMPQIDKLPERKKFDLKGTVLFMSGLTAVFSSLLLLQEGSISFMMFIVMFIVGVILLTVFIWYEGKIPNPLLYLGLFFNRMFSSGLFTAYLSFIALSATILFIPFYLQLVLGLRTRDAGLMLFAYPLTTAIVSPISGWLSDKISPKPLILLGLGLNSAVLFVLSAFNAQTPKLLVTISLIFLGIGVAVFQSPNNSTIMGSVHKSHLGVAGGINALFRNIGLVSGTTLSVMLFSLYTKSSIDDISGSAVHTEAFLRGFRLVLESASMICLFALLISIAVNIFPVGRSTNKSES